MTSDFIGVADLATFMRVEPSALATALADLSVQAAQTSVRRYLDQVITYVADDVVTLDGNDRQKIRLHERPVRSVKSVVLDNQTVDPSDYILRNDILVRTDSTGWLSGLNNIWNFGLGNMLVTYSHGWDTAVLDSETSDSDFDFNHVPADISLVTLSLARRIYHRAFKDQIGVYTAETIGSYSYTLAEALTNALLESEKSILDNYLVEGYG